MLILREEETAAGIAHMDWLGTDEGRDALNNALRVSQIDANSAFDLKDNGEPRQVLCRAVLKVLL
jgi:hypothetical protein